MARLVARALRVGRSALIQTDSLAAYQGSYRLSYLIPALLWPEPAILALPEHLIETVLQQDIPNLQQNLPVIKSVRAGDRWPCSENYPKEHHSTSFRGLLVTSAQGWLRDRLSHTPAASTTKHSTIHPSTSRFPNGIPTLIDGVGELEQWVRTELSVTLSNQDWEALMLSFPSARNQIRDLRVQITHTLFQHPANPYGCHLIDAPESELLCELHILLQTYGNTEQMPAQWQTFWDRFFQSERLAWSQLNRSLGHVSLCCGPTDIDQVLSSVWDRQPVVLMGAALDPDKKAARYRQRLGLGELTCLQFGPDRHHDLVQLYLPDRLPMPNTSQFRSAVLQEIRTLLNTRHESTSRENAGSEQASHKQASHEPADQHQASHKQTTHQNGTLEPKRSQVGPIVIIVGDVPLKTQFASILAAEFGSRVQLEASVGNTGILITGWEYWRSHQSAFKPPALLIITTLPIPSLENPLVASRVATYKKRRQDWFKSYLLPEALSVLQHAIAPVRSYGRDSAETGIVALLDNRVNHRSYGRDILEALNPAARSSYLDPTWFHPANSDFTPTYRDPRNDGAPFPFD
ncbi:MAG: helicase C-terminal domain-containing protein [Cyanobacteria bacterium J06621_11]